MQKWISSLWFTQYGWFIPVGLIGVLFGLTDFSTNIEENLGLEIFYAIRGQQVPPDDVVIISMDKESKQQLHLPDSIKEWPRRLHAELINKLSKSGAKILVFDVLFKKSINAQQDQAFANALQSSKSVILFERLTQNRSSIASYSSDNFATIEQLIAPIEHLKKAAVATAPFPLPKRPFKVSQYWTFIPQHFDKPTLPVVAYALLTLDLYADLYNIIEQVSKTVHLSVAKTVEEVLDTIGLVAFIQHFRQQLTANPNLSSLMLDYLQESAGHLSQLSQQKKSALKTFIELMAGGTSHYLNYYGPPGSIKTISYYQALKISDNHHQSNSAQNSNPFRNKIIFIGSSERDQWDQIDSFITVYSRDDGLDISGVEIAATAFANLHQNRPLNPLASQYYKLLLISWCALLALLIYCFKLRWAVLLIATTSFIYSFVSVYMFQKHGLWLPITTPLFVQMPIFLAAGAMWRHIQLKQAKQNVEHAFRYYVPQDLVKKFAEQSSVPNYQGEMCQGICLATDAGQYTALAEKVPLPQLKQLMDDYYACLFDVVKKRQGEISDVVGDAMMALWTQKSNDEKQTRLLACQAGVEILHAVERFNQANNGFELPTRIGIHFGEMLLGNVGAHDHFEYRAMGDIVNTATRIESLNKILKTKLLVSKQVIEELDGLLTRAVGYFTFVGKTTAVEIFELVCLSDTVLSGCPVPDMYRKCKDFEHALNIFYNQDWVQAKTAFRNIVNSYGEDGPSQFYIVLCAKNRGQHFGSSWNKAISMHVK